MLSRRRVTDPRCCLTSRVRVVLLAGRKQVVQFACTDVDLVTADEAIEEHPAITLPAVDLVVTSKAGGHPGTSRQVAFTTDLPVDQPVGK
jgi:hypothetical protein